MIRKLVSCRETRCSVPVCIRAMVAPSTPDSVLGEPRSDAALVCAEQRPWEGSRASSSSSATCPIDTHTHSLMYIRWHGRTNDLGFGAAHVSWCCL